MEFTRLKGAVSLLCIVVTFLSAVIDARPQTQTLVALTTTPATTVKSNFSITQEDKVHEVLNADDKFQPPPIIAKVHIRSDIQYRYARTVAETSIKNPSTTKAQEVVFSMVLPDTAFISNFTIRLAGDENLYVAKVAKKEEAQDIYDTAVQSGQTVGKVNKDTRDANRISVSVNLEAAGKLTFTLTYEELLKRVNSKYEHILHVQPGQLIKDYRVDVYINESLPLRSVIVPELKTDPNEITSQLENNPVANIEKDVDGDPNKVHIIFKPDIAYQKRLGKGQENEEENGMEGQFIVQYDVDLSSAGGNEIQVLDGYFVHYFAPEDLQTLPRHVVFVVDVSGSMSGTKIRQTKDALVTILDDMTEQDYFDIITFSNGVSYWKMEKYDSLETTTPTTTTTTTTEAPTTFPIQIQQQQQIQQQIQQKPINPYSGWDDYEDPPEIEPDIRTLANLATEGTRNEALQHVLGLRAQGGTNINDALLKALKLIERVKVAERLPANVRPSIVFLTDGEATSGVTSSSQIRSNVKEANKELNVPIFGLAFGVGADFALVRNIALESGAFARRIYETSDAAIQLEDFQSRISSPLLYDVDFKYVGGNFKDQTSVAVSKTFYKGGEYIFAGKLDDNSIDDGYKNSKIVIEASQYTPDRYEQEIHACHVLKANKSQPEDPQNSKVSTSSVSRLCFPIVKPEIKKTAAENFIERLWAFLTIQNLLEVSPTGDPFAPVDTHRNLPTTTILPADNNETATKNPDVEKTNKEKALEIALKYNFVTDVTSLVVVKPNEDKNASIATLKPSPEDDEIPLPPLHNTKSSSGYSTSYVNLHQVNYGYSQKVSIPKGGSNFVSKIVGGGGTKKHFSSQTRRPPPRPFFSSPPLLSGTGLQHLSAMHTTTQSNPIHQTLMYTTTASSVLKTSTFKLQTFKPTTFQPVYDVETTTELEKVKSAENASLACNITLFSRTYLRGDKFVLGRNNSDSNQTISIGDLSKVGFDNKLTSLKVGGGARGDTLCCFRLYSKPNFEGKDQHFRYSKRLEGKYESAEGMGALFRAASSIQLLTTDCNIPYDYDY